MVATLELVDAPLKRTAEETLAAYEACSQLVPYCLTKGGRLAENEHIRRLLDCAEICQATSDLLLRGSPRARQLCGICADFCRDAEKDCRRYLPDEAMQRCAQICRRAAETCAIMAA